MLVLMEGKSSQVLFSSLGVDTYLLIFNSLIQFYPHFEEFLRESLRAIVGSPIEKRVEIGLAKDGSGVGGTSTSTSLFNAKK